MDFEISAMNVDGFAKALKAEGLYDEVLPELPREAQVLLQKPFDKLWHRADPMVEAWRVLVRKIGGPRYEALNLRLTRDSFGPVVRPLLKIALVLGGSSPASVFSRVEDAIKVAMKNVTASWTRTGAQSGHITIEYPCAMDAELAQYGWQGVFRFADELTGKPLRFDRFEALTDRRFVFHVSW